MNVGRDRRARRMPESAISCSSPSRRSVTESPPLTSAAERFPEIYFSRFRSPRPDGPAMTLYRDRRRFCGQLLLSHGKRRGCTSARGWRGNWHFVIADHTTAIRRGKAQKWTCSSVSACALLACCCLTAKADSSKTLSFECLPDGTYLIERTLFSPPKIFTSSESANAYLEEVKKHPELEAARPPMSRFFNYMCTKGTL